MLVSVPLCYAPARFLIQVPTWKRPELPSSPPAGCQPPRREGTSEDGMYKNELRPQEAPVTTTMTHCEWQFTEYFHILPTSLKPGSQAELWDLLPFIDEETEVQGGVMSFSRLLAKTCSGAWFFCPPRWYLLPCTEPRAGAS